MWEMTREGHFLNSRRALPCISDTATGVDMGHMGASVLHPADFSDIDSALHGWNDGWGKGASKLMDDKKCQYFQSISDDRVCFMYTISCSTGHVSWILQSS